MPIYEYRCKKGHQFELMQSFSDEPLSSCEVCGAPVQKLFHPVSVHFKGSGFYNTDYGTKRRTREAKEGKESAGGGSDAASKGDQAAKPDQAGKSGATSGAKPDASSAGQGQAAA